MGRIFFFFINFLCIFVYSLFVYILIFIMFMWNEWKTRRKENIEKYKINTNTIIMNNSICFAFNNFIDWYSLYSFSIYIIISSFSSHIIPASYGLYTSEKKILGFGNDSRNTWLDIERLSFEISRAVLWYNPISARSHEEISMLSLQ